MSRTHAKARGPLGRAGRPPKGRVSIKVLVGSGDKIALFTLPFLVIGLILNIAFPSWFSVGGPPTALRTVSIVVLAAGVAVWAWTALLIVVRVPRGELITSGPYAVVKHPLYTGVALLVAPWLGFLLDTWLGVVIGFAMYVGSRIFATAEEAALARTFGRAWDDYRSSVWIPWL